MFKLNQRGVVHLLIPIILLLGIIGTVYLINAGPLKLFPHASSGPISGPVTPVPTPTPVPTITPTPTPIPNPFSGLSATLTSSTATYNFSYSGLKDHFEVDMSSSPNFGYDIYYKFGDGKTSPVTVTNVTKMSNYTCGATRYWRVRAVYLAKDVATSGVQTATISCSFSNLSATLAKTKATFNFNYPGKETLYKVHLSTSSNFTTGVYYNFTTGSRSPLTQTSVSKMSQYKCGATLYWKVEAVYTGNIMSPVQSAKVRC